MAKCEYIDKDAKKTVRCENMKLEYTVQQDDAV
jgi:hypothetical protein